MNTSPNIFLSIPEIVNLATILNLIILFIILFFRKNNTLPNKILAFILLIPAFNFLSNYFILSHNIVRFPLIIFINQTLVFFLAPLLLYYCTLFISSKFKLMSILNVLTLSAIIFCLYISIKFSLKNEELKESFINKIMNYQYPAELNFIRGIYIILLQLYFFQIAIRVKQFTTKALNTLSSLEKIKIRYLQQFVIILWTLNIIVLITYLFVPNKNVDFLLIPLIVDIFYIFLLRTSFKHAAVFTDNEFSKLRNEINKMHRMTNNFEGNTKKLIDNEQLDRITSKVNHLLEDELAYTDKDICIQKFSEKLGLKPYQVSYYLNNYL
ncbi:MAG: hypothetical protein GXO79_09345 [Chlorobi bacterium]|nr:hypothetical protein [Chlorobiota bacterium]